MSQQELHEIRKNLTRTVKRARAIQRIVHTSEFEEAWGAVSARDQAGGDGLHQREQPRAVDPMGPRSRPGRAWNEVAAGAARTRQAVRNCVLQPDGQGHVVDGDRES
jgi:hypothetical protein